MRKAVIDVLASGRPTSLRDLIAHLEIPREAGTTVKRIVHEMVREGAIVKSRGNLLAPASRSGLVRGRLQLHRHGFGFVVPEEGGEDLFIPRRRMGGALGGDLVAARVVRGTRADKPEGEIVEILDKRGRRILGLFRARDRAGTVTSFDPAAGVTVLIPGAFRMGAEDGDAVAVDVLRRMGPGGPVEGKVIEVLGPIDEAGVDVEVVARRHGLALEFPDEALREAENLPEAVPRAEAQRRERFDAPPPVTIDGETARDFDDAVAVEELTGGGFRLFVHIADVGWFVEPGSPLDREARARGTSTYFPDRVLPMFPEALSNDLCSLKPDELRLVQSAVIEFDRRGATRKVRFADGVIRSAARLNYTQVADLLEGGKRHPAIPAAAVPMLRAADRLRQVLEARRRARGSVDFDLPEPRILLDVEGVMTGITVEPRNRAHLMIEEFMLAANEAVAAHLEARGAPCLYRIHETPEPTKIEGLREFARGFGLDLKIKAEAITPSAIQKLLDAAEGSPGEALIAQVALRSMKQARYSPVNTGHFGLAAPVYAHFTSPIRRYPDLVVHRALRALRHKRRALLAAVGEGIEELAESCSRLERAAEAAEREILEWKKIAFMKGKEGQTFDGVVTGVARFGLFVQLVESLVEGLLHVERLSDERFDYIESRLELRGARSGRAFRLGDRLRVLLTRVDIALRRVDLAFAPEGTSLRSPAGREPRERGRKAGRRRKS